MGGEKSKAPVLFHGELPTIREAERILVEEVMKRNPGDTVAGSLILGISREDLVRLLTRYRVEHEGDATGKKGG